MSGLFSALTSATRALEAQRFGLELTGQNIANVNTPGYARREVVLASVPPNDLFSAGNGVDVEAVRAARDRMLERRLQMERPAEQRDAAIADTLSVVDAAIGRPGQSIDALLDAFFDSASRLSEDPTSTPARYETIRAGQSLASAFRDMAGRMDTEQHAIDTQIQGAVDEINDLAGRFASLNSRIGAATDGSTIELQLRDEQSTVLDRLSQLVDVDTVARSGGGVDLTIGGGHPLVIGASAIRLEATSTPPDGLLALACNGQTITSDIAGGRLGGFLQVRDVFIPGYLDRLDALAYQVATEVNALHADGYDAAGNAGGAFFVAPAAVAGAAASLALDPDLEADPQLLAAAGVPAAGDNQTARAIAGLRDMRVMNGGQSTLSEAWAQFAYRVGSDTQAARHEQLSRADIVKQVAALADAVSGVSLDEEAMMMLRFQRAYEANAQFFRAVDESIDTLLQMIGS